MSLSLVASISSRSILFIASSVESWHGRLRNVVIGAAAAAKRHVVMLPRLCLVASEAFRASVLALICIVAAPDQMNHDSYPGDSL
jgi:hypothetical protein